MPQLNKWIFSLKDRPVKTPLELDLIDSMEIYFARPFNKGTIVKRIVENDRKYSKYFLDTGVFCLTPLDIHEYLDIEDKELLKERLYFQTLSMAIKHGNH